MPENIRYAIARDPKINNPDTEATPQYDVSQRTWWQIKRDDFGEWDTRQLFKKVSTALALIWKYRDLHDAPRYKYTLITVTRATKVPEEVIP